MLGCVCLLGCVSKIKVYLVGALYSNIDLLWVANIPSNEQGIGSLHMKSWFSALSASSLVKIITSDHNCDQV